MPLKQLNLRCELLLERWVEPTCVYASWLGYPVSRGLLALAWKWLLRNHPHDSICGCSVDRVEWDMKTRFAWCEEIGEELLRRNLRAICREIDTSCVLSEGEWALVAFNPAGGPGPRLVEGECFLPWELLGEGLVAVSPGGKAHPVEVLWRGEVDLKEPELLDEDVPPGSVRALVRFSTTELPSHGYAVFRLRRGRSSRPEGLGAGKGWIENGYYRVAARADGTLEVVDKGTGEVYSGLHRFEDLGDRGDTYTFDPVPGDSLLHPSRAEVEVSLHPARASLTIRTELHVPEGLSSARDARGERHARIPIEVVSLYPGIKRVDFVTQLENTARDHRLRVLFPSGVRTEEVWVGEAFDVVRRQIEVPAGVGWAEAPYPTRHFRPFVYLDDGTRGFGLITRGLPEYEVLSDGRGTIALTLLRCVGWLARHDLVRRRDAPGALFPAPGAQCLGPHRFEYAVYTGRGSWEESGILRVAEAYVAPARPRILGRKRGRLPARFSFVRVAPSWVPVSAVKPAEEGELWVVRLYNPTEKRVKANVGFPWAIERLALLSLSEELLEELPVVGKEVKLILEPKEILTLGVALEVPRGDDV